MGMYKEQLYKLLRKSIENFSYFFQKVTFFMTGSCKLKPKTKRRAIFGQYLFGNFCFILNLHSNGIQYVKSFRLKIFHNFF